jgi:hypothetical protein
VLARVVVVHLVVVPGRHPGESGVGGLEQRVTLVEGVADPVVVDRLDLRRGVLPARHGEGAVVAGSVLVLVDVVAEEEDNVQVLLRHVAIGGVMAGQPVLARREGKPEPVQRGAHRRRRLRPSDRAELAAGEEAIEVLAPRLQPPDIDADAVAQLRGRTGRAGLDDRAEPLVGADLPQDLDRPLPSIPP